MESGGNVSIVFNRERVGFLERIRSRTRAESSLDEIVFDESKFFSLEIFVGLNGVYFLLATMIALLGILLGRQLARSVMEELVEVKSEADWLISQVVGIDELLSMQSGERLKVKNALERAKENILGRERLIIELQQEVDALNKKKSKRSAK